MRKLILLTFACLLLGGQRVYSCPTVLTVEWDVIDVPDTGNLSVTGTGTAAIYDLQAPWELVVIAEDTGPEKLPVTVIPLAFIEQPGCKFYGQACNRWTRRAEHKHYITQKVAPQVSGTNFLTQRNHGKGKY
jgi:hypothetical protein